MSEEIFSNPIPVVVAVVPYRGHLLGIRRNNAPGLGEIALPGGYLNTGETVREALCREVKEETGVELNPEKWEIIEVYDLVQANRILIFGKYLDEPISVNFSYKDAEGEVQEVVMINEFTQLAFASHIEIVKEYFKKESYYHV